MELNVPAFGVAGGIVGLVWGLLMSPSYAGMMGQGYGMMSGLGFGSFMGVWMAVLLGVAGAFFAWLYNQLSAKMG